MFLVIFLIRGDTLVLDRFLALPCKAASRHQLPVLKIRYITHLYIETVLVHRWGTVAKAVCVYSEMLSQDTKLEPRCKIQAVNKILI